MSKMTRADILRIIDDHRAGLYDLGVRELALFGSYARGEAVDASDVDILVDFHRKSFESYMAVKERLESLLQRRVDLVLQSAIKPRLKETILREAIRGA
jgi:predicted nucleotidyltransferase